MIAIVRVIMLKKVTIIDGIFISLTFVNPDTLNNSLRMAVDVMQSLEIIEVMENFISRMSLTK